MKTAASVEFKNVSKAYGNTLAVRDVSFTITPGHLVTLLGPSGCGKTTTLRLIAGLEMATSGKILIGNKDVTPLPTTDRDVSMVFQSYALFPHMNVNQNVGYGLEMSGWNKSEIKDKIAEGLDMVGLHGYGERLPSELSGGQQQRVAVARAMVLEPQVLLFDEPLSNLDAKLRRRVRQEIRELQQKIGITTVYVTHDQEEALAVSDRIIVMNQSVISQEGTPTELYETPKNCFVADFIGEANLIKGNLTEIQGDHAIVQLGNLSLNLPHRGLSKGEVNLAIRPRSIRLSTPSSQEGIDGTIKKATYLGSHLEYMVDTPFGELFVIDPVLDSPHPSGASVHISFAQRGVNLVNA